jgi:hypothetical protein
MRDLVRSRRQGHLRRRPLIRGRLPRPAPARNRRHDRLPRRPPARSRLPRRPPMHGRLQRPAPARNRRPGRLPRRPPARSRHHDHPPRRPPVRSRLPRPAPGRSRDHDHPPQRPPAHSRHGHPPRRPPARNRHHDHPPRRPPVRNATTTTRHGGLRHAADRSGGGQRPTIGVADLAAIGGDGQHPAHSDCPGCPASGSADATRGSVDHANYDDDRQPVAGTDGARRPTSGDTEAAVEEGQQQRRRSLAYWDGAGRPTSGGTDATRSSADQVGHDNDDQPTADQRRRPTSDGTETDQQQRWHNPRNNQSAARTRSRTPVHRRSGAASSSHETGTDCSGGHSASGGNRRCGIGSDSGRRRAAAYVNDTAAGRSAETANSAAEVADDDRKRTARGGVGRPRRCQLRRRWSMRGPLLRWGTTPCHRRH